MNERYAAGRNSWRADGCKPMTAPYGKGGETPQILSWAVIEIA